MIFIERKSLQDYMWFHFSTPTMGLFTKYFYIFKSRATSFLGKGKTPIYGWQYLCRGNGSETKVDAFVFDVVALRLDRLESCIILNSYYFNSTLFVSTNVTFICKLILWTFKSITIFTCKYFKLIFVHISHIMYILLEKK